MKKLLPIILCVLLAVCVFQVLACAGEPDAGQDTPTPTILDEEAARIRAKSPVVGTWRASTPINDGDETEVTTLTFNVDGTVTSVYEDGTDAFLGYASTLWNYDPDTNKIILDYVDFRGMTYSYTMTVNVAKEDRYIILLPDDPETAGTTKISLTR